MVGQNSPLKAPVSADGWRAAAICLVLAAITFAVFGRTLHFGFINFDDDVYVYENSLVAGGLSMKGLAWDFTHADCHLYHPLTMFSLMVDHQLYGLHAGGYHFTNVFLHAASAILLFLVLRQMTGALWRSAFIAAVFAIHPLRVESVAWVAERKDVLSGLFFMLTLGAYVHFVRKPNSLARYLMVVVAFILALLSKPTVVTVPFVLLLLDYWPLQRMESAGRLISEKIPLLALAAGACATTVLAATKGIAATAPVSMAAHVTNAAVSYAVYLRQMVWPAGLAVFYPPPENGHPIWTITISFLLLTLVTGGAVAFRRKCPWLLAGWLWYLGMLTPMVGLVQVSAFAHADRMTYLPQIGVYLAATWLVAEWRVSRAVLGGLMAGVLGALIACAWQQTAYWHDSETLWPHTLDCTTNNELAQYDLGIDLFEKGRGDDAIGHLQEALRIKPDDGDAHNCLGKALLQKGNLDEAITQFQDALQTKPGIAEVHFNLGDALRRKGEMDEAIAQYQNALRIDPNYVSAHVNLGSVLLQSGNAGEAAKQFQKALEIDPNHQRAHYNLGLCFYRLGRMDEAVAQYQKALQLEPADPSVLNNLAWLLATCPDASLRNGHKAVELAQHANTLTGGETPVMLHTLAAALAEAGQFPEAVETAQHALRLAEAQSNTRLAAALQSEMKLYQAGKPFQAK